jgi:carboxymethylenebutenolidase
MNGQDIRFPSNGHEALGFFAQPTGAGPGPGVVVIQEWWGLNEHIRDVARRFAEAGFAALAPDLYHGRVVTEPNDAQKEAMGLDRGRAMQEIDGAVAFLKAQPNVLPKRIGVVGFCMGGGLALHTAPLNPDVGAVVAFYGGGAPTAEAVAANRAAILGIVGDRDRVLASMQALEQGFAGAAFPHQLVIYPDAEHAFFNDTRPHIYKADAAADAWQRTLAWFGQYLTA